MPQLDLTSLREFGQEADRLDGVWPAIEQGGYLVPGRVPTLPAAGKEVHQHERREEARSAAGARQRPSAEAAAPRAAARPLGAVKPRAQSWGRPRAETLDLEELYAHYPGTREAYSSSRFLGLVVPIGIFRDLPFRARLALEVPLFDRAAFGPPTNEGYLVPDVRAWATWEGDDVRAGTVVRSHHQYPDLAACAHLWRDWILGVHPLHEYVAFCILWLAKTLHERELGFYPGRQHSLAHVRVARNRPREYCGCTSKLRYRECHMAEDDARTYYDRWRELQDGRRGYLAELRRQGREPYPPEALVPRRAWAIGNGGRPLTYAYEPLAHHALV